MLTIKGPARDLPVDIIVVKDRFRQSGMGDIEALAEDIKELGQITPIMVSPDMRLIHGERRLRAIKSLGWPTIRAEIGVVENADDYLSVELSENVHREPFTVGDRARLEKAILVRKREQHPLITQEAYEQYRDVPRTTTQRWLKVADILEAYPEFEQMYETQDEILRAADKLGEKLMIKRLHETRPPEIVNAPSWAKDHYIVGDAVEGLNGLAAETFHFAEVDPPYAIEIDRRKSRNIDEGHSEDYIEIEPKDFPPFMKQVIAGVFRTLKQDTFAVFWYGMQWHGHMYNWLTAAGFRVNQTPAIWYKGQVGQTAQPDIALASVYEPFWLARKGTPRMRLQGKPNVFHHASVHASNKIHLTEKPIELLTDMMETILFPGSNVLVPFLGSGVTLRAAYRLGHTGLGFDMSQNHKDRFLNVVAEEFSEDT